MSYKKHEDTYQEYCGNMVRRLVKEFPGLESGEDEVGGVDIAIWLSQEIATIKERYPKALNRVISSRKQGGSLVNWLYDHFSSAEILSHTNSRQFWAMAKQVLPETEWRLRDSYVRAWRKEKKRLQSQLPLN